MIGDGCSTQRSAAAPVKTWSLHSAVKEVVIPSIEYVGMNDFAEFGAGVRIRRGKDNKEGKTNRRKLFIACMSHCGAHGYH